LRVTFMPHQVIPLMLCTICLKRTVPFELAPCLDVFILKKYFSLQELNLSICQFPYKWNDKTNCPQSIPFTFVSRESNAHKTDIVELVMALVHTEKSIVYMESKISEYRYRFLDVFPGN
ncbi:hypothetical protein QTP70_033366, partial [Hemibagrus guttatus]